MIKAIWYAIMIFFSNSLIEAKRVPSKKRTIKSQRSDVTCEQSDFSVADYIRINGQPIVENKTLFLWSAGLTSLEGIELIHNKKHIKTIELSGNRLQLSFKDQKRFSSFSSLNTLNLSNNELTAIPKGIFKNLRSLQVLDLSYNHFGTSLEPDIFCNLSNLKELYLRGYISTMESESCLSKISPGLFKHFTNLECLDLSFNDAIEEVDEQIFNDLKKLKKLSLSHTDFMLKNGLLKNLTSLEILCLCGRGGRFESNCFEGLINLKELDMSRSEHELFYCSELIRNLPAELFRPLISLETLDLSRLWLKNVNQTIFQGLKKLKKLCLSCNALKSFSIELCKDLESLETLHLQDNNITYLDPMLLQQLPYLKEIDASGNPILETSRTELLVAISERKEIMHCVGIAA